MNSLTLVTADLSAFAKEDDWSVVDNLCGMRASRLCQLQYIGFDIPKSIVITTNAHKQFLDENLGHVSDSLFEVIYKGILRLEGITKRQYGSETMLLLSLSSNFPIPSAHCVGLNDYLVQVLEKQTNNTIFAYNCYQKLIQSYGVLVCGITEDVFDDIIYKYKCSRNYNTLSDFKGIDYVQIVKMFKALIYQKTKKEFPQNPNEQLRDFISGIYNFYETENIVSYLSCTHASYPKYTENSIEMTGEGCTILINSTIFGAKSKRSCSLVVCTNDTENGEYGFVGSYGIASFMDDVCEGRTETKDFDAFQQEFPKQHKIISNKLNSIIRCYKKPMEIKFVIENDRLYVVGIKPAQFGGYGHITSLNDIVDLGVISENVAISNISPVTLKPLFNDHLISLPETKICSGFGGSNGTGSGRICFSTETIRNITYQTNTFNSFNFSLSFSNRNNQPANNTTESLSPRSNLQSLPENKKFVLLKRNIFISDIDALSKAQAVITSEGSPFSRGVYIARSIGVPGAFACKDLLIEEEKNLVSTPTEVITEGKVVTVDFGDVFLDKLETEQLQSIQNYDLNKLYETIVENSRQKFEVLIDAPNIESIKYANTFSADGIGFISIDNLCSPLTNNFIEAITKNNPDITDEGDSLKFLNTELVNIFKYADKLPVSIQLFDIPLDSVYSSRQIIEEELEELHAIKKNFEELHQKYEERERKRRKRAEEEDDDDGINSYMPTIQRSSIQRRNQQSKLNQRRTNQRRNNKKKGEEEDKIELPAPEEEIRVKEKIEKLEKIINLRLSSIHLSYIYPLLFTIQVKLIMNAAKIAKKESGAEPTPRFLLPFSHDERDMRRLSSLISSLSKEYGVKGDLGCVGISPANIANASKVVKFIYINPFSIFQSGEAPYYIDNSLWHHKISTTKNLLLECVKAAKRKAHQLPITLSSDRYQKKSDIDEIDRIGITSISTNLSNIIIARVCTAQKVIAEKPEGDHDSDN